MRVCMNITLAGMGISTSYFRAMMKIVGAFDKIEYI